MTIKILVTLGPESLKEDIIKKCDKFVLPGVGNFSYSIKHLIRSNLFFRTQYPARNVNSVYFDTYNYISIRQNLDGVSNKKKIRIRWYGNRDIITNPVVEIKSKKGFETKKESRTIKELDNIKLSDLEIIKEKLNKKLFTI